MDYEENLIIKVAWFYYMENMTQQQISEQLNISRMKIVKYLEKARSQGVVQFKIKADGEKRIHLERALMKKFELKDAYVIPTVESNINESIAKAAAQYIEGHVKPNCYINVGYGDTVSRTMSKLISSLEVPVSLVTLSGGVSCYTSSIAGTGKNDPSKPTPNIYFVPSPLILSSAEMAESLWKEKSVSEVMDMAKLAHITVTGIGAVDATATIFKDNMISQNELVLLKMNGAVGDILSQFYDKDGNMIETELHNRLISTKLEVLKNMDNVIGVAGGESKVDAIHAALTGGYFDVLITDEKTAASLTQE